MSLFVNLYKVIFRGSESRSDQKHTQIHTSADVRSVSPSPGEFRPLTGRFRRRSGADRMRIRARRFRAERMILTLLGGMREHAAQLRAGQAVLALGMLVGALVTELARWEGTAKKRLFKNRIDFRTSVYYKKKINYILKYDGSLEGYATCT